MSVDELPILAVFPGDCTGIGPEQTARILSDDRLEGVARILLMGDRRVIDLGMKQAGVSFEIDLYDRPSTIDW
jgi:4-hydroxythreonine-4-phosphate dehydrogenase